MNINIVGVPVPLASPGTVTITNASPAVITKNSHALLVNTPISFACTFATGDVLPKPLVEGKQYYVAVTPAPAANTFSVSEFPGGTAINTTTAGQGTFTGNVELLRVDCTDLKYLGVLVRNRGANALNLFDTYVAFKAQHQYTGQDQDVRVGVISETRTNNQAADYTTPLWPLTRAPVSPVTLAAGAAAFLAFDVSAVAMLSMRALIATAAGTVDIEAVGKTY